MKEHQSSKELGMTYQDTSKAPFGGTKTTKTQNLLNIITVHRQTIT